MLSIKLIFWYSWYSWKIRSRCKSNQPNWRTLSDFFLSWLQNGAYHKLQSEFQISLLRFMTLPKFRPRCKLNQPNWRTLSDFFLSWLQNGAYWRLQSEFQISLCRFRISSKFRSRCKLNEINWRRSLNPILVPKHHFGYSTCYRMNQTSLCWYSESASETGPSASRTIPIGDGQIFHTQIYTDILPFMASFR